ncbi:hypothetical protein M422DRAFT_263486 [Sphaerobolus stellatus SS14]|uniref:Unplaced genomic scaffold SPHSTscaffold_125, whole genome shotgun sequence n=1 Tax=Sphaerobolus stellatus (strain SS14) TaxID=990650 RepID=A0A0C9TVK4_SPHS4|nr:hypothetical protein M422DRAFT_263486 [Sphaerobolus stellatus SS14]
MTTRIQPANAPPPGLAPKPTRRTSGTPNRTDIGALAGVIESFGNFRKSDGKLGTTAVTASALQAVAILLREAEQL